jgi:hypothetical protein
MDENLAAHAMGIDIDRVTIEVDELEAPSRSWWSRSPASLVFFSLHCAVP